jgi:hypothetical protein
MQALGGNRPDFIPSMTQKLIRALADRLLVNVDFAA